MRRFKGIYWRQFGINVGLVALTLVLLGTSFFALTYTYVLTEKRDELEVKAQVISRLAESAYSDTASLYELWNQDVKEIMDVAEQMSDIDFLIWLPNLGGFISTDTSIGSRQLTLPQEMGQKLAENETYAGMTDLGIYDDPRFVVAIPANTALDGTVIVGPVLAITEPQSMTSMWRVFLGIFGITAFTVLIIAFVATATTTMQQLKPIRDMVSATRKFADGNFDARVYDSGRSDELGELTAAFNTMANSLQKTELQRRDFIANISHELKTPMTTIAGYADGILDGVISEEEAGHYLQLISDESRRMARLVRRMLDVSQLQSIDIIKQKKPFDLSESMRRVLVSMEKKITDRGLDVAVEIPEDPVMVLGDNDLITQVIYNLLENAVKFAAADSTISLFLRRQGGKALVQIRNEGETISPEELPRLFERFHKTDRSRSADKDGVGLGLYIVRTILEQHRESITAESEDGVTTFSFTLQLAEEPKPSKNT